jgi:hypothetical protein
MLSLLYENQSLAQQDSLSLQFAFDIPVKAVRFSVDNLGNVYVVTPGSKLLKYNIKGVKTDVFVENIYGQLSFVDATNPLNLLLFYRDFATIIVLDNFFNQIGVYQLNYVGFTDITAIGFSQDNLYWVYDNSDNRLKKMGYDSKVRLEGEDLLALGLLDQPANYIVDKNKWVYVNVPSTGILIFDIFAQYYKTIPVKGLSGFQVMENHLVYYQNGELNMYHLKRIETTVIPLPQPETIRDARIGKNRIYILREKGIDVYDF